MTVNVKHVEASISRFNLTAVLLAEKVTGLNVEDMEHFPLIIGVDPIFLTFTSRYGTPDAEFITPYIVNASFSLELVLKAIIYYESNEWYREHNLIKLYEKISVPLRRKANEDFKNLISSKPCYKRIVSEYKNTLKKQYNVKSDFKFNLAGTLICASNAFETWRYAFDVEPKKQGFYGYQEAFEVLSSIKNLAKEKAT